MSVSTEQCWPPVHREYDTWTYPACSEVCCVVSRRQRRPRPGAQHDVLLCRTPGVDRKWFRHSLLQSVRQRWSDQPALCEDRRFPLLHQLILLLGYGDKVESRQRVCLNHGTDREPLPKAALQTPPRRWKQSSPLCRDEPQSSPNRRERDRQAYEHIVLRKIRSAMSCVPQMSAPTRGMPVFAASREVIAGTLSRWSLRSCPSPGDLK
jgi:hypothetical protein